MDFRPNHLDPWFDQVVVDRADSVGITHMT